MPDKISIQRRAGYSEVDRMGMVYYGRYLAWFEEARVEWLRRNGFVYRDLEDAGYLLPVTRVECDYCRPVEYDACVTIEARPARCFSRKVVFAANVLAEGRLAAASSITLICIGPDRRIRTLPSELREIIEKSVGELDRPRKKDIV